MAKRKTKTKIKDLVKKYKLSAEKVISELKDLGLDVDAVSSVVPEDFLELAEEHLEEMVAAQTQSEEDKDESQESSANPKEIHIKSSFTVKNLAEAVAKKPNEIISELMSMNILAHINQSIEPDIAEKLCRKFGYELVIDKREKEEHQKQISIYMNEIMPEEEEIEDDPADLVERPPVVTFLGHVDHGKTSLQDRVRESKVVDGEAGGITQHIGASTIQYHGKKITFIDTPGHEAFTAMRARGANVTDIAILVVAADDGFMPQTIEALEHARAAKVPIIVAVNKMDLPGADPDKILLQMQQNNLMSEDWGGDVGAIRVSAKTGEGIDNLLDRIILESEMLELKANPERKAQAVVLESQLEQGFGTTVNVLVTNGTLKIGNAVICNECFGRVKNLIDEHGKKVKSAGPSTPVKVVGLNGIPEAGARMIVCENEKEAKNLAARRTEMAREHNLNKNRPGTGLEDVFSRFEQNSRNNLKLIIKADVKGSAEAIEDSLRKLPSEKINTEIILSGVGAITENDVLLAAASEAIVIGFHVRVNQGVNAVAKEKNVEIRLYSIIYELLEDITEALTGRLAPDKREKTIGKVKILQIFEVSKGPKVCGCIVEEGVVRVGSKARVFRNEELIFNGEVRSLRRFQDDVKEVRSSMECGIRLDNFLDFQENDIIELYEVELKKATL